MSLSKNTIHVVKQTVPALRDKGEDITTRMYEILFSKYPETEPLFKNAVNQNVKVAGAILAYAENIDQLDNLSDTLDKLAQKHVDVGVKPEHYPLVADALMSAIVDVLGSENVTDEVAAAWTEAYTHLAEVLQEREAKLYAAG